jgi:hypothetical protein
MIANNDQNKQLPNELESTFKELKILRHLRKAGITNLLAFLAPIFFSLSFV